jgi:putative transposase
MTQLSINLTEDDILSAIASKICRNCWVMGRIDAVRSRNGILVLTDTPRRGGSRTAPTTHNATQSTSIDVSKPKPLGRLIGAFKTISTKDINQIRNTPGIPIWQRNYYEHIIRHKEALQTIRHYIRTNPQSWNLDRLHPDNPSKW